MPLNRKSYGISLPCFNDPNMYNIMVFFHGARAAGYQLNPQYRTARKQTKKSNNDK